MTNFEGNPNAGKKKPAREKMEPITKNVSVRKESEFKKFKKNFFHEDAKTVKGQVFSNVIIPGLQRLVRDMVNTGIDVLLYGGRTRDPRENRVGYVSYSNRGVRGEYDKIPSGAYSKKDMFSFDEVVLFDRGEAEQVLLSLMDQIDRYGMVSVADFYDTVGRTAPYTANKYGWRDLRGVGVERVKDGYSINFPKAIPLD